MKHVLVFILIGIIPFSFARINENLKELSERYGNYTILENDIYSFTFKGFTINVALYEEKAVALTFLKDDGQSIITPEEIRYILESNLGKDYKKSYNIGNMEFYEKGELSASYVPEYNILVITHNENFDKLQNKKTSEKMEGF